MRSNMTYYIYILNDIPITIAVVSAVRNRAMVQ